MDKLLLIPDADGYSADEAKEIVYAAVDGGAGRARRDIIGASKLVHVTWTMNPVQYEYWRAFFVTATERGSLPFLCDLVSEYGGGPAEHTCQFIPGSVKAPMQQGRTFVQEATLEVIPLAHDADADEGIILLFELYGMGTEDWINLLEHLVNVKMPEVMG